MSKCYLCPNNCGAERNISFGACRSGEKLKIAKYCTHHFEEPCISGTKGSGAIFFCGCSLACRFCQNYEVSRNERGKEITSLELADIFKSLENSGVHNINLVNPTHYVDKIIEAFSYYHPKIPVVYNTHGYENLDMLEKIDEFIDIYLPDIKFFSAEISKRYTGKSDYFNKASKAITFMANKKTVFDENGIMKSGTIIRHLALPQNTEDSISILKWYGENFKDKAYLSIMSQYTPFGDIKNYPELNRKLTKREYDKLVTFAVVNGFDNVFIQDIKSSSETYIPVWDY